MQKSLISRRDFLDTSTLNVMAGIAAPALTDPAGVATQLIGIRRGDLPDLTIKQVKVYALDAGKSGRVQ